MGQDLYERIVPCARKAVFYGAGKVPDTVDGRFEILGLHVFLVTRALCMANDADRPDQWVFDAFFLDMDSAVREMGVGDTLVGKRIKRMAQAWYGRSARYMAALDGGSIADMQAAIRENLLATVEDPDAQFVLDLAQWAFAADTALQAQGEAGLFADGPDFPDFAASSRP